MLVYSTINCSNKNRLQLMHAKFSSWRYDSSYANRIYQSFDSLKNQCINGCTLALCMIHRTKSLPTIYLFENGILILFAQKFFRYNFFPRENCFFNNVFARKIFSYRNFAGKKKYLAFARTFLEIFEIFMHKKQKPDIQILRGEAI